MAAYELRSLCCMTAAIIASSCCLLARNGSTLGRMRAGWGVKFVSLSGNASKVGGFLTGGGL